ncbi:hypothetical protein C2G38_1448598 [Gigaspora rosea]|uniref:Uncharacterized protein n=1 Tax=Gigaspora rosea TaxID=44941 RepID=A0A397W2Y5_9GLOM|nr:hypothetical protein C2G38_1448598 [Gigaspora rosea]
MASQKKKLNDNVEILKVDWEQVIDDIVGKIVKTQAAETLSTVRQKIYELQSHCILPSLILKLFDDECNDKWRLLNDQDDVSKIGSFQDTKRTSTVFHLKTKLSQKFC